MATNELGTRCAFILFDFFLVSCDSSSSSTSLGRDSISMVAVIIDGEILLTRDTRMDFRNMLFMDVLVLVPCSG